MKIKTLFILRRDCYGIAQVWYEPHDQRGKIGSFRLPVEPSLKLRNHSPDGFEWGYGGSGPAQLALALILQVTGSDKIALDYYQQFKFEFVARVPKDGLRFTTEVIRRFLERQKESAT
jgi:hypothetical protein